ncbi:glycosyltransferase [Paenibacillus sp. LMG 31456]|uniref:Glycosyltransferase n=1 Tax=Paenibacillus foliorum TaxID=2654974 RepID=A0A972GV85_9BACL|nr:glycosyltransferase family A protein [Paenibacillus foliorum]NOU95114.1 glycosyltransferase [Paenibacillus foliorum]
MNIEKNIQVECYKIIYCITKYCKVDKVSDGNGLVSFISDLVYKEHIGNQYLKTLVDVILAYLRGKIPESVISFYLEKQFLIEKKEIVGFLNVINFYFDPSNASNITPFFYGKSNYPKVNVIMTTYNRRKFLEIAINSFLQQDYPNIEIIVIDDCSSDGTDLMMRELYGNENRVIYKLNEKNLGPGINRLNAYETYADGEYILFFDDDDYLIDMNYITKAIKFHINHPEVAFVGAGTFYEYTKTGELNPSLLNLSGVVNRQEYFLKFMSKGYPKPCTTTTVFKKESLTKMNILEMKMVNDTPIFLRALLVGDAGFIDIIAGVYRIHGGNITFNCSFDFIIVNLLEKIEISKMAIQQYDRKQIDNWWNHNAYTTISYYLYNSAKHSEDFKNMYAWTKEHCPDIYEKLIREFRWLYIKRKYSKIYNYINNNPCIKKSIKLFYK